MLYASACVGDRVFCTLKRAGLLSLTKARVSGGSGNTRITSNSAVQHPVSGISCR